MKILKNTLITLLTVLAAILILIIIWGGGFGEKSASLPLKIVNRHSPLIIAHRGATAGYVENSASAFVNARHKKYPAVEIDVQRSRDGQYFLFHDETTDRLLGFSGNAAEMDIKRLQAPSLLLDGVPTDDRVLLLEEFFHRFKHDFIIYLDFKRYHQRNYVTMAAEIDAFLSEFGLYDSVIIGNGNAIFVAYLERNYPQVMTCLEGVFPDAQYFYNLIPKHFRPDFVAGFDHHVTDGFAEWLRENNMTHRAIVYHVTDKNIEQVLAWGINNLIARDGEYLKAYLE